MNITWQIDSLIVNPQIGSSVDVVVAANWRVWAEENGVRGTSHGRINFPPPQGDKFTAYPNLTEETILQWVWDSVSMDPDSPWSKQIGEERAIAAVRAQQASITEKPLPWVPPPPPPPEPGPTVDERLRAAETLINLILDEEGV